MSSAIRLPRWCFLTASGGAALLALAWLGAGARPPSESAPRPDLAADFAKTVRPLLRKHCLACHSTKAHKGDLDLERFASLETVRKDLHAWQQVADQITIGEMPPRTRPQPSAAERKSLLGWIRALFAAEARARAGDPGPAPLRRLDNAEYENTVRDLIGVELRPARDFPADGAAGEGFANASAALAMSPALIDRYLRAAKDIAGHAVLLPDGIRFSTKMNRRDWAAEVLAELRRTYAPYGPDGRLPLLPTLEATLRHRDVLAAGQRSFDDVATAEKLSPKYLRALWSVLNDKSASQPLDTIRARWRAARDPRKDAAAIAAEIAAWQARLWKVVKVGSYVDEVSTTPHESTARQVPRDPVSASVVPLRLALKPAPGQAEVVLELAARELTGAAPRGHVVWQRPRLESKKGPPLLLRDYASFGPAYEIDTAALFRDAAKYLDAVSESAHDRKATVADLARKHALDAALFQRWLDLVALRPTSPEPFDFAKAATTSPAAPLSLLDEQHPKNVQRPAINGWRSKGAELPIVLANASERVERIPGTARPRQVVVHPTPGDMVAVTWTSPLAGVARVAARISHAHPDCGNGVAWWLAQRRDGKEITLTAGVLDRGGAAEAPVQSVRLAKGDVLVLAIDARNGDHSCDLTEIGLTITSMAKPGRTWDLSADVAQSILDANPHADRHGNRGVWSFVKGSARRATERQAAGIAIPPGSILARWRAVAADPDRRDEASNLARRVQILLAGPRPASNGPDAILYDGLLAPNSPLLRGLDRARLPRLAPGKDGFALPRQRFGTLPGGSATEDANLVVPVGSVTRIRLPAALLRDYVFVVEGRRVGNIAGVVQFTVAPATTDATTPWDGKSPLAADANDPAYRKLLAGYAEFRRVFPLFVCFPKVVPDDVTVSLKMYHREDEPLGRLFLDDASARRLDRLWAELRFISRQPVAENDYLPQFIGYTTQDTPKELQQFFLDRRPWFQKKAADFRAEEVAAEPAHLRALLDFADRAYRRPLRAEEKQQLLGLHKALRTKGVPHDAAFRSVLARVLVSPNFLYRVEKAPPGAKPALVADLELATRLSYFLWASLPDAELRRSAEKGELRDPAKLTAQVKRMLHSSQVRGLATEFGLQWLQVRDIREHREKSEKLFPTFDDGMREAFFEEAALLFQDCFQSDRPVTELLDGDHVFVNETLARHYGLADVKGSEWRKRIGARKLGRGGVLTLSAVLTKQAGASRTSPILRGNWVVQVLLGEKLPRPPANVPQLPAGEDTSKLSVRQLVEQHTKDASCAHCHRRIDPFGFALEGYDPIGRRRTTDLAGRPVDARAALEGGIALDGIDGLRDYLVKRRRDDFLRTFCRKLLGYALGRSLTLADGPLVDEMLQSLQASEYRVSAAILPIVRSTPFRFMRGSEQLDER